MKILLFILPHVAKNPYDFLVCETQKVNVESIY